MDEARAIFGEDINFDGIDFNELNEEMADGDVEEEDEIEEDEEEEEEEIEPEYDEDGNLIEIVKTNEFRKRIFHSFASRKAQ